MSVKEDCDDLRKVIGGIGKSVKMLMDHEAMAHNRPLKIDVGEMKANIMLSYRHLEDARMRLGKVIQAEDGGVSVYDK